MSHSTPSQPPPQSHRRPLPPTATPRFSPYPPAALRTSLFSQHHATPSSLSNPILSTPRSLALPSRTATPYSNGNLPSAPRNTPLSAFSNSTSSFGPDRFSLLQHSANRSTPSTTKRTDKNPFEKLSATDFDQFVNGLRDKVKNALDPEVERKRLREEREERQRARDEKERERERIEREKAESETQTTKDVFGDIKNVTEPESAEKEVVSEEDEDENLINGQEVKIDPNQERESSYEEEDSQVEMEEEEEDLESEEEEEEPLKFERPKSNGKPVEIVILDSDEEEEQREKDRKSSLEREDSIEEDYSGVDEDELEESGVEDEDSQSASSRSPTPNSLPPQSPRRTTHSSRTAPHGRPQIDYPDLSVPSSRQTTADLDSNDVSARSSPPQDEATHRSRSQKRERSPLFRPRNEGSVSLSAPEDFDLEVEKDYFSQEEEEEEEMDSHQEERAVEPDGRDREMEETGNGDENVREHDFYQNVFDSIVNAEQQLEGNVRPGNEDQDEEEEVEESMDLPPVSQRKKRDAFGRPIRYQEEDGEGGEFEGYEEEEGFGEDLSTEVQDYQFMEQDQEGDGSTVRASYGFSLEDLAEVSVKAADRIEEEAVEKREESGEPENLGTIELDDSDDEELPKAEVLQVGTTASSLTIPPEALPFTTTDLDLLSSAISPNPTPSDLQIDDGLRLATSLLTSTARVDPPELAIPATERFLPSTLPLPLPLPESVLETNYDFRTPPEAQEELLDVDQVRMREMERLPFLQEAEIGKVFEGYEEEDSKMENEVKSSELELPGESTEPAMEPPIGMGDDEEEEDKENFRINNDSPQDEGSGEGEAEFFGEGIPGDEVVPGAELESDDEEEFAQRASYSGEDSEDLGSRIPYEAKGKGKASPSPSANSDDLSRLAPSDPEDGDPSPSFEDDDEYTWNREFLADYDLRDLERVMQTLGTQLRQTRSQQLRNQIMIQLNDVQDEYLIKGGEVTDEDDSDAEEEEEGGDRSRYESGVDETAGEDDDLAEATSSPDRSAFDQPMEAMEEEDEVSLSATDRHSEHQIRAIASQLVDLQSTSNPQPSLHIGASNIDHPEAKLSSHFRQEDVPQPKLDDPLNLPPPPASITNVNDPAESQQQDDELNIERIVADEQQLAELPRGEESTMEVETKEQADQLDQVQSKGDEGGLTIVDDDDETFGQPQPEDVSVSKLAEPSPEEEEPVSPAPGTSNPSAKSSSASQRPKEDKHVTFKEDTTILEDRSAVSTAAPSSSTHTSSTTSDLKSKVPVEQAPRAEETGRSDPAPLPTKPTSTDVSPFIPLPPTSTTSISRTSGPNLSRFSSHFRYEPNGPPPPLDAPLNLPAPPPATTNVDEPMIREQQDEELEPEIQASNEEEVNELHKLSEMVDYSHDLKPHEADDFEQPPTKEESMIIIDDDEPVVSSQAPKAQQEEAKSETLPIEHRKGVGATPPPPSYSASLQDSMIVDGSAPPQNPALTLSTPPRSPSPRTTPPLAVLAQQSDSPLRVPESASLAADEIRFDDVVGEQSLEEDDESDSSSASDNDESEAEVAHVLLSPHKRSGGVLGFSGGAEEFGETILMNSDSEEEEQADTREEEDMNGDVGIEEIDLDSVKLALRKRNAEEELEEQQRQVSEAPSSEPISYASSDEREKEDTAPLFGSRDDQHFDQGDFGGGFEEGENEQLQQLGDLPVSPERAESTSLRIHDVFEPGEWDPSKPIEFGPSATVEGESGRIDEQDIDPIDGVDTSRVPGDTKGSTAVAAIVEMSRENEDSTEAQTSTPDASIADEIAHNVVEALSAEMESSDHRPSVEVDAEVIEKALKPSGPTTNSQNGAAASPPEGDLQEETLDTVPEIHVPPSGPSTRTGSAVPFSDQSESGDEILLASRPARPATRRSPRRPTSALPEDKPSPLERTSAAPNNLEVPSPIRRSSRLSSAGPSSSSVDSPSASNKGKRSRRSDENGAAASSASTSSTKKPRRSAHGLKYREEVTEDEEPVPAGSARGVRVHHHHQNPDHGPTASSSSSQATQFEPPLTRSRCHFTRLKISSLSNKDSAPYEFLVPACALNSSIAIETMRRSHTENLGPVDESMHCRGTPLGDRGFDSDAAKIMNDRHPSKLVPDEDILDTIRRIVSNEIFDEGEVELLPRETNDAGGEEMQEETEEREEGEIEEGEVPE